ncbi:MAG: bifunctional precorrin-2 dehydrogenase/sirohydrochlorin ferrochelatase [Desulfobulbaceae bacterium]|jgi:precorrin-2 dehydrogenase/sirohydrochlorin ferrochelatase|nr:bifunctional precorrin-2 dehydrogenase/sirohydrochlorin ferrochelatase [Desulfobulbaceae bacterium]
MPDDFYAINLRLADRLCLVVGGGSVAARKTLGLLERRARTRLVSPRLTASLAELAAAEKIEWLPRAYQKNDLNGAALVFAATNDPTTQEQISRDAEALGIFVNRADDPERGDFHLPATVRRGDLLITISTSGKSPALAAALRRRLQGEFGDAYAPLTELCSRLRPLFTDRGRLADCTEALLTAGLPDGTPKERAAAARRILTAFVPEHVDIASLVRGIF